MKKIKNIVLMLALLVTGAAIGQSSDKLISSKTHIMFFSTTPAENIKAHNSTAVSVLNKHSGAVVFTVPMQGFEFKKSLMQKHFNNDKFLDTKQYPKAKLKAKVINISEVDFSINGTYEVKVEGKLTIKGVTNSLSANGTITVEGEKVTAASRFMVKLTDYGIRFLKGKPSTNIAKEIEVTVKAEYLPE